MQPFEADLVPGFVTAGFIASAAAMHIASSVEFRLPPEANASPALEAERPPGLRIPLTIALRI